MSDLDDDTITLSDLMFSIAETVDEVYAGAHWITAELAAAHQKSKGYWVLELEESDANGKKKAQTQALVWANNVPQVIYKFQKATGQKLSAGMRVKLLVTVSFHPQWGFRLTAMDIDTSWTLGEAQANNKKIRDTLTKEGLWDLNKKLPSPTDFYRVAIIAPDTSAGLEDFMREANALTQYGLTQFDVYNAPFEGNNAVSGIPKAFQQIANNGPYDAVCVVRGGGAASGIAWLNQEEIIRAACTCAYPLLTGIGHERDQTLVDEVANIVCGTPSKTIQYVTGTVVEQAQTAADHWNESQHLVQQRLILARQKIKEQWTMAGHHAHAVVKQSKLNIEGLMRETLHLGPIGIMQKGYAVVQANGEAITSKKEAEQHTQLTIRFHDGVIPVKRGE